MLAKSGVSGRVVAVTALACTAVLMGRQGPAVHARSASPAFSPGGREISLPRAAEHRYRVSAKIRPLLLFWVGPDNVGSARMVWYRGEGDDRGYEIVLGSDPDRTPRRINRWGWVAEEHRGGEVFVSGVMKQSDEMSLEEATARVDDEQRAGFVFTMIRERIRAGESVAEVTTARVDRDYSYREVDRVIEAFGRAGRQPEVKRMRVDLGVRPGMLSTLTAVIHEDAEAWRRSRASRGAGRKAVRYAYNAKTYILILASSRFIGAGQYGGRTYARLVQNDFEVTRPGVTWKEKFTLVYNLDGPHAESPVFISYQPRWWFKAELSLDDTQQF